MDKKLHLPFVYNSTQQEPCNLLDSVPYMMDDEKQIDLGAAGGKNFHLQTSSTPECESNQHLSVWNLLLITYKQKASSCPIMDLGAPNLETKVARQMLRGKILENTACKLHDLRSCPSLA
jgi:hypothetical protein